jgi:AcrR family transcriptional regulator
MTITDDTQQRLLEAAEQVFAEKGFVAASVREICKRAGANVAAVNYYFGDKERLYNEAVKYAYRTCIQGVPFPDWPPGTPPEQKLRGFVHTMMGRMLTPQEVASTQLMMRELAQPTAACFEVVRDYIQPIAHRLLDIVTELMPPGTSVRQRSLAAFSIVGQCLHYRHSRAVAMLLVGEEEFRQYDVELLTDHITNFSLHGLGAAGTGSLEQADKAGTMKEVLP